mgnify:CR=1 FL=1
MTVIESLISSTTIGIGTAVSGVLKSILLTGASQIVKNGATVLADDTSAEDKAKSFDSKFVEAFNIILDKIDNSEIKNKEVVYSALRNAKTNFLNKLGDAVGN